MTNQQQKADVEIGRTYRGKVKNVVPFGIFVEILPGREGLCHISEFDHFRIEDLNDHVKVGDPVDVVLIGTNEKGQLRLSRKATIPRPPRQQPAAR
jgi:polyribonucleotide nucleotidyltransferase